MSYKNKSDAVKYNNEYNKKSYDRINFTVPKGYRDVIRDAANANVESVNSFIIRLIHNEIGEAYERNYRRDGEGSSQESE